MRYRKYEDEIIQAKVTASLDSIKISGKMLTIKVLCPAKDFRWTGLMLSYNYKIDEDREDYLILPVKKEKVGKYVEITCKVDLAAFPFRMVHWSFYAIYEGENSYYKAKVLSEKKKTNLFRFLFKKDNYTNKDGKIVFVYIGNGSQVMLRYRERDRYDGLITRWKECLARFYVRMNRGKLKDRKIWLVYEKRCEKAQDNGYYFFKYCMDNDMEKALDREIYYVMDKTAIDRKKLNDYNANVLDFMSLKYMIYILSCQLLISSDGRSHAYIWQNQQSMVASRLRKKKHIFLGHGVLALKRLNDSFSAKQMRSALCTATSEAEARVIREEMGFKAHQVAITGYARFDALRDQSEGRKEILVMPTHRSWLFGVERDVFTASDYYKRYMDLINSPELIERLEKEDITLNFYLHPSIGEHVDAFSSTSDHVKIVPYGQAALDDLMMQCKLLVTDYSSVSWDVYYLGKPIIFYQYDLQAYLDTWGSYIDLEKDSPGERVTDHDSLIKTIESYIDNGFEMKEEYLAKREEHYEFIDQNNAQRICKVLKARNL